MITEKKYAIRPILESSKGIHLTAYLVNQGNWVDIRSQLRKSIARASEWLSKVQKPEETKRFLEPLSALLLETKILKGLKGNIAIFRNQNFFRLINIPIEVQGGLHLASSFHVKPLLRWLQGDKDFLLLGVDKGSAHLYAGSQFSLKLVDSILFPEPFKEGDSLGDYASLKKSRLCLAKDSKSLAWISNWIAELTINSKPKLFLAGAPHHTQELHKNLFYENMAQAPVAQSFGAEHLSTICQNIREVLKEEARKNFVQTLQEFKIAEKGNRAKKNIFQIAKAVVRGKVRKLIVTDEVNIFGKIDTRSGGLSLHHTDLDHEDDCILDDLAQMVLSQGGEVLIAKRSEIPTGHPILAILDDDSERCEKAGAFAGEVAAMRIV